MMRPGEMKRTFVEQGLANVAGNRADDPHGLPELRRLLGADRRGQGPLGKICGNARIGGAVTHQSAVRDSYEADGPTVRAPLRTSPGPAGHRSVIEPLAIACTASQPVRLGQHST